MLDVAAQVAGVFWVLVHLSGVFVAAHWWYRERQTFYVFVALSWICVAASGIGIATASEHWARHVAIVVFGSGSIFKLTYLILATRYVRRRITTVLPGRDGTIHFIRSALPMRPHRDPICPDCPLRDDFDDKTPVLAFRPR